METKPDTKTDKASEAKPKRASKSTRTHTRRLKQTGSPQDGRHHPGSHLARIPIPASPKWRRQILPDRWMRPGSVCCTIRL